MAGHVIEFKRCRPTQSAATRHKKRVVSRLWHNGEIVAAIFSCGSKRPKGENLSAARHGELIVFCRPDIQSDPWIDMVQTQMDVVDREPAARSASFVADRMDRRGRDFNRSEPIDKQ